jgi:hypothetical protein
MCPVCDGFCEAFLAAAAIDDVGTQIKCYTCGAQPGPRDAGAGSDHDMSGLPVSSSPSHNLVLKHWQTCYLSVGIFW